MNQSRHSGENIAFLSIVRRRRKPAGPTIDRSVDQRRRNKANGQVSPAINNKEALIMANNNRSSKAEETDTHHAHPAERGAANHLRIDPGSAGVGRRSLRVLVVVDDPETADELARTIGNWGHEVRWISDGSAALHLAIAHRAEVALLDIALSGMSGYVVARELRHEPRLHGCFLLAMRWRTDRRRDKQFREADIDMFLAKPLDLLVLETLLALESDRLAS